jgi:hypothetical protein
LELLMKTRDTLLLIAVLQFSAPVVGAPTTDPVMVYNISHFALKLSQADKVMYYDRMLVLQTLQGIVNRDQPRLLLNYGFADRAAWRTDDEFFDSLFSESGGICVSEYPQIDGRQIIHYTEGHSDNGSQIKILTLINRHYLDLIDGMVLWDPAVPATSNAAVTVAGARDYIAVMYSTDAGSQHQKILGETPLTVQEDLHALNFLQDAVPGYPSLPDKGSKNNVYYWLVEKYLKTGLVTPSVAGIYLDAFHTGVESTFFKTNNSSHLDWMVLKKGFVFDLMPWPDGVACDGDPGDPAGRDWETISYILGTANSLGGGVKHGYGFPGGVKYTEYCNCGIGNPGGVRGDLLEHELMNLYSENNFVNVSTDCETGDIGQMANKSFLKHLVKSSRLKPLNVQECRPKIWTPENGKVYLLFSLGDYDGSSWAYSMLMARNFPVWTSPARGGIPLLYMINPRLLDEIPWLIDHIVQTRTPNDYFAGEMGFGYYTANLFPDKAGLAETTKSFYSRLNLNITGFHIATNRIRDNAPLSTSARDHLASFSPCGVGYHYDMNQWLHGSVPFVGMQSYLSFHESFSDWADRIESQTYSSSAPNFLSVRSILVGADTLVDLVNELNSRHPGRYEAVDPYTFFYLLEHHLRGGVARVHPQSTAAAAGSSLPDVVGPGSVTDVSVTMRNTGLVTWRRSEDYKLGTTGDNRFVWTRFDDGGFQGAATNCRAYLAETDAPYYNQTKTFGFAIVAPQEPGTYRFSAQMVREGVCWFGDSVEKDIVVDAAVSVTPAAKALTAREPAVEVRLIALDGRIMMKTRDSRMPDARGLARDHRTISSGIYLLEVRRQGAVKTTPVFLSDREGRP